MALVAPVSPLIGRSILVTGGTGSFGQAFVRRCLADGARRVVIYSRDEAKQAAMAGGLSDSRLRFFIGDVRDDERLIQAMRGVDDVVHAAALKRIETCEANPDEAVCTNITGTQNVATACILAGVERACLLSTDKAAAPNTLYGATKLAAERSWLASNVYAAGTATRFVATRYGNVLGSTGSVVPLWKAQAPSGEITITDLLCSRFFMTMTQAVDLVVTALSDCRPGALYVPKIFATGILQLAKIVAPNCAVRTIGLRPGEKLHETLITHDEARRTYDCGAYYLVDSEAPTWGTLEPIASPKVPADFTYRSDVAEPLLPSELREMAA